MLLESNLTDPTPARSGVVPIPSRRSLGWAALAATLSGALLWLGTGLHPVAWLTWLALVPVAVLAARTSARLAAAAAFIAWFGGGANVWTYLVAVHLPVPVIVGYAVLPAVLFTGFVLLLRTLLLRGRPALAVLAAPCVWAAVEYLVSALGPDGAFWSLAYTQSDVLPVMQTVSLTGPWGVTYLLVGGAAAVAAATAPGVSRWRRRTAAAGWVVVLVVACGYGVLRLHGAAPADRTRIALVAQPQPGGRLDSSSPEGRAMLDVYLRDIARAAVGAQVVVLPEAVVAVDAVDRAGLAASFRAVSGRSGAAVVLGAGVRDRPGVSTGWNTAQVITGGGTSEYRKQHLILGAEAKYRPGHDLVLLPGQTPVIGVQICKDLDFPGLTRAYRALGAAIVVAPAHDVGDDGWLHARMAVSRGIESGVAVARSTRDGRSTISDSRGRILADADTSGPSAVVVSAAVPSAAEPVTPYARAGDWFAWVSLAVSALLVAGCLPWRPVARRGR